jgi:uncharacterized protein (TIGR03118 family)
MNLERKLRLASALSALVAAGALASQAQAHGVTVTNLVSDGFVPAPTIDPDLVNPWGLASAPGSPIWVNDNGTGVTTLYNGAGTKIPLTVKVFPNDGSAAPTGQVFNTSAASFVVHNGGGGSGKAVFLMDTENGTISGWAPALGANTFLGVDNSGGGDLVHAVYKGLAIGTNASGDALYAANFRAGDVEVYNGSFGLETTFTDPNVAPGYAPFNVQALNGNLFVSFGLQDSFKHDEVDGAGLGYVDEFSMDGTLLQRITSAGGPTNAPWGMVIAPASFGPKFAGDLLVGNFGDGTIDAFNLSSNTFVGQLKGPGGAPIMIDGLWGLMAGNGPPNGGDTNKIFFSAGLDGEQHGLFGSLGAVPEPATWATMLLGFGMLGLAMRRTRTRSRLTPA